MGNACAGPQAKEQAERERRQEAALSLAAARGVDVPVAVAVAAAAPAAHDAQYEAQLQLALQQSQQQQPQPLAPPPPQGEALVPRAADDAAAMMAAIAASEQEAARMRLHEEEHDAELQAALQASQREMAVLPREFAEGAQSPNPFDDDPFADEPQPQPAPATPPQFDVFAALKDASSSTPPKKSPDKVSMKQAGDQFFNDMAAPLQQAVEWIGTVTQRDFSEYTAGADDFERGSNLMMFVSLELHDGALLCTLLNTLFPGTVAEADDGGSEDATRKNFDSFRAGCQTVGVPPEKLFSADDLQEDPERVVPCIMALRGLEPTAGATPI